VGFFHFLRILPKNGLLSLFSDQKSLFATSSINSESEQETLPENVQFCCFLDNFGESWWKSWAKRHSIYSEKQNATNFFIHIIFRNDIKFASIDIKAYFKNVEKIFQRKTKKKPSKTIFLVLR
jgi:hypothetical protein